MQFKRLLSVLPLLLMLKAAQGTGLTIQGFIRNRLSDTLHRTWFTQYQLDNLSDGGIVIFDSPYRKFLPYMMFQYLRSNNPSYTITEMIKCYKNLQSLLEYQRDGTRARYRLEVDITKFSIPSDTNQDLVLGLQCDLFCSFLLKILLDYDKLSSCGVNISKRINSFLTTETAISNDLSFFLNHLSTVESLNNGTYPDLCWSDHSYMGDL